MKRLIIIVAALTSASPAFAQEEEPLAEEPLGVQQSAFDLSGEIRVLSDYRFRGVSRSDEDPALQSALTLSHRSGVYAGARGTSLKGVDGLRRGNPALGDLGDVQLDLYAGYGGELGGGWEVDAGAVYYLFAGGDGPTDYVEPYASISYLIGPVYATAGAKYAPSQDALCDEDMLYLFGQVDVSIPFRPWSFTAALGHQDGGPFPDYWNWSLGVQHQLQIGSIPETEIGLSYVDSDLRDTPGADATVVASIAVRF